MKKTIFLGWMDGMELLLLYSVRKKAKRAVNVTTIIGGECRCVCETMMGRRRRVCVKTLCFVKLGYLLLDSVGKLGIQISNVLIN